MCRKHLKNTSPSEHEDGLVLFGFGFLDKIMASRFMILEKNAIGQISKISPCLWAIRVWLAHRLVAAIVASGRRGNRRGGLSQLVPCSELMSWIYWNTSDEALLIDQEDILEEEEETCEKVPGLNLLTTCPTYDDVWGKSSYHNLSINNRSFCVLIFVAFLFTRIGFYISELSDKNMKLIGDPLNIIFRKQSSKKCFV